MVARQLWTDSDPTKIQRSRTRDLSRQFRGEKAIEWRVIEVYLRLLFPDSEQEYSSHLDYLRPLHAEAFGSTVDPDGQPTADKQPTIDAAYVAELSRQLDEARTRAAFATALLVIVQAENTALRGRGRPFDWFGPEPRRGSEPRPGTESPGASRSRRRSPSGPGGGRHEPGSALGPGGSDLLGGSDGAMTDPATAPISRRQVHRAAQRRRATAPTAGAGEALPSGHRQATYPATPTQVTAYSLAALTRYRSAPTPPRRVPVTELPSDDLGPDILVGREKRRRGRAR